MKNLFILSALITLFISLSLNKAFASIEDMPLGGKISIYPITGIVCPTGYGPFSITPANVSVPGPFLLPFYNSPIGGVTLSVGQWVLGLYRPIPTPGGCVTTSVPPAPVPTFEIKREFKNSGLGL